MALIYHDDDNYIPKGNEGIIGIFQFESLKDKKPTLTVLYLIYYIFSVLSHNFIQLAFILFSD